LSISLALPATPLVYAAQKTKAPPAKAPASNTSAPAPAAAKGAAKAAARAAPAAPAEKSLDLTYVQPDAFAVAVFHPRAFFQAPELELFPREVITAAVMKETGIDPATVERVVISYANFQPPQEPLFAVAAYFSEPLDPAQALLPVKTRAKESKVAGKTYWVDAAARVSFAMPDNRTVVVAPEPVLKQLLSGKAADTPMTQLLKRTDFSAHSVSVVSLDAIRNQINALVAQLPPLPPQFQQFLKIPELVSSLEVRAQFGGSPDFEWIFHARDDQAAEQLEGLINQGVAMGKEMLLVQMSRQMRGDDPVEKATAQYARRLADHFAGLIKPARNGTRVTFAIDTQGGWATTGILVALLLPAIQAAREAARRTQSMNNMRQITIAMLNFEGANRTYPPRAIFDKQGKPLLSWRVAILPYLEEGELYREFHLDEPWDSEHNKKLIAKMPATYANPSFTTPGKTTYLAPAGDDTILAGEKGTRIRDVVDGTSKTILILEADPDRAVEWTRPDDYEVDEKQPFAGLGHLRAGQIFLTGFADGSVRAISLDVDPQTFLSLLKKSDGRVIDVP
jgi:hypothetical protein